MKQLYAIVDTMAETLVGGVHVFPADAVAVRFFSDIASDPQTMIARHPADHELVHIATIEDDGEIVGATRRTVLTGSAWKAAQDATNAIALENK